MGHGQDGGRKVDEQKMNNTEEGGDENKERAVMYMDKYLVNNTR